MNDDNDPVPSRKDFADSSDDLDEMHTWKDFGGLTVSAAYQKFCENSRKDTDLSFNPEPAATGYGANAYI